MFVDAQYPCIASPSTSMALTTSFFSLYARCHSVIFDGEFTDAISMG